MIPPFIINDLCHSIGSNFLIENPCRIFMLFSKIATIDKIKIEIISKADENNLSEINRIFNLNDNLSFTNIRKKNKLVENTNE